MPSSRETIDLISDDELDAIMAKSEEPDSTDNTNMPTTVTMRKRPKAVVSQDQSQDETPSRPPLKKQKSPERTALPNPARSTSEHLNVKQSLSSRAPEEQVPDSEGEDEDAFFDGEDLNFDNYDFSFGSTSGLEHETPQKHALADMRPQYDDVVPESPSKTAVSKQIQEEAKMLYPRLSSSSSIGIPLKAEVSSSGMSLAKGSEV